MKTPTGQIAPLALPAKSILRLQVAGKVRRIEMTSTTSAQTNDVWQVMLDGRSFEVNARLLQSGVLSLILDGRTYRCLLEESLGSSSVSVNRERFSFEVHDPRSLIARRHQGSLDAGEQTIKAPMSGRIVRVLVEPGQDVTAQQPIVAIEAMKMQNELKAVRSGKVKEVRVSVGQTVTAAEIVVVIS